MAIPDIGAGKDPDPGASERKKDHIDLGALSKHMDAVHRAQQFAQIFGVFVVL